MNIISESLGSIFNSSFIVLVSYIPKFIAGILILLIGIIVASILKDVLILIFKYFRLDKWFETAGLVKEKEVNVWSNLLAELVRWTVIFLFLMSTVDVWGIPKVGEVLNQLLLFLPNVFVAVIVGLAGLIISNFAFDIVRHSVRGLGGRETMLLGNVARYSILFFTALIILSQLGVASELIKILFTGIVSMLALALGLAFGLGGKDHANRILENLFERIEETSVKKKN